MSDRSRAASVFDAPHRVTLVCGLPRAGTSLVMQILEAAGLSIARDAARPPDPDNPRGYFELAAVKAIRRDVAFLDAARGRVIKVVSPLLPELPSDRAYRILFIERDLGEVLLSQRKMLRRLGRGPNAGEDEPALERAYRAATRRARAWIDAAPDAPVLFVVHAELIASPIREIDRIAAFLARTSGAGPEPAGLHPHLGPGGALAPDTAVTARAARAMAAVVDPALYRARVGS